MATTITPTLLQPNDVAYMVGGKWLRDQASPPPNATRIQKDYSLVPGKKYRLVHKLVVGGKVMNLPGTSEPALLYSPWLDAESFGQIIPGSGLVNIQPNFPLDDPAREYWFEVQV